MARSLNGGSDRITCGDMTFAEGATYFSIGGWANFASLTNYGGILAKAGCFTMNLAGNFDNGSDDFYVAVNSGERQLATNANILTTNRWDHYVLVFDGSQSTDTDRLQFFFNGVRQTVSQIGAGGAISTTLTANTNNLEFGRGKDFASAVRVAEWGSWSTALVAKDCAQLAAGYAPPLVRPDVLETWWPFFGNDSPEIDRVGPYSGTLTGTSKYAHPRIIYPRRRSAGTFTGTSPPPPPPSNTNYLMPMLGVGDD